MIYVPILRTAILLVCSLGVVLSLLIMDFGDRGPRFAPPTAAAKTDRAGTHDLAKARNLARVVGHIRAHYVDPDRVDAKEMAIAAMTAVQRDVPEVLVEVLRDRRDEPTALVVTVETATKRFALDRVGDLYELNWKLMDIFDFIERNLPPSADLETLEYTAINGLLGTLDPHSMLLPPRVYREMQLGQKGRFGGLGIVVSMSEGLLKVMSVMDETPAQDAGIEAGDRIVRIDNESTINMGLDEAVNLLRGRPDSEVTVWIKRKADEPSFPVPMVRREIRVPSVDHAALGDGIGYVHLRSFQNNTTDNLHAALDTLRGAEELKGLVIDLRNNPGGLLNRAISVSDTFLERGNIVTTVRDGSREREESHATSADTLAKVPIVVLINKGSASASEIVAGALKRNDRAVIVGETSFGKGSVQVLYKIDEAALKLTIAQYLTPRDISIQNVGIVPDIAITGLIVDSETLDLYPDSRRSRGEANLSHALDSDRTIESKPSVELRMLGIDLSKGPAKREGGAFSADALVLLAKGLLIAAPSPDRKQALIQAAGFLSQRQAEEAQKLERALTKMGVDWSAGDTPKRPVISVELVVAPADERDDEGLGDDQQAEALMAGEMARVVASITNRGRRPLFRVHGRLVSGIGALNEQEMAFGRINAGETVSHTLDVFIPASQPTAGDRVKLELFSDEVPLKPAGRGDQAYAEVEGMPRPIFAQSWTIVDHAGRASGRQAFTTDDVKGSGDGLIQRGETIALAVRVTNVGSGPAKNAIATVKNESGQDVFITEGRQEVGALAVGETKTITFGLVVREGLKARSVQLRLAVADNTLKTWATDDLNIRVYPLDFPKREARDGLVRVGADGATLRAGAHRDAQEIATAAPETVLKLEGQAGSEWLQVSWRDGAASRPPGAKGIPMRRWGWLRASKATVVTNGSPSVSGVSAVLAGRPPIIAVKPDFPLVVSEESVTLTGEALFAGGGSKRRHMYIFRGGDKVFFKSARTAKGVADALPFRAEVPLQSGSNLLTVIAREGDDQVTRETFVVFRR